MSWFTRNFRNSFNASLKKYPAYPRIPEIDANVKKMKTGE